MGTGAGAPTHAVDRPALRHRLDEALSHPLTLVVAPAGAGKSVLLAQWVEAHPELSWVRLDIGPADDDPVHFALRLLGGLAAIDPDFADLASLATMHGGGLGEPLLEALGARMLGLGETVIVLDDLHHLGNSVLLADLGRLVAILPPRVHLVLSSRADPPLAWSRHRLRSDMTEIRQADLALDDADSAELLQRICGRSLGADSVSALVRRTEGWAAGLQLAAMTLRRHADPDEFITQFSGNDRLVADFLSEEVLAAQTGERRRLLLHLSVLDELCADLVDHLTGRPGSQLVLEELERESMFLIPLDTRRQWFRFHHLFRDLLLYRLRAEDPGAEATLLGEAARWHLRQGALGTAMDYLVAARDWDTALEVIRSRGSEVLEKGEMATVARWIAAIPETERAPHGEINLLLGFLIGTEGRTVEADDILRRIAIDPVAPAGEQACALAFRSAMVWSRSDPSMSIELATRAIDSLGRLDGRPLPTVINLSDADSLEAMAVASAGRAHLLAGRFPQARRWLERSLALPGASYSLWRIHALGSLGLVEALCGRTQRAEQLATEALAVARSVGLLSHPAPGDAYLASALVDLECGEPRRAALPLHEASVRFMANGRTQAEWICHLATAMRQGSEGLLDEATSTVLSRRNDLGTPPPPMVADRVVALRCRLLRLGGMPAEALRIAEAEVDRGGTVTIELAAAALTLGRVDVAAKALGGTAPPDDTTDPLAAVEFTLVQAWASDLGEDDRGSRGALLDALGIADRHRLVDAVVRAGPVVLRLVSGLPDAVHPVLRSRVGARVRQLAPADTRDGLVEPLTDRELEILAHLPSRATNAELAELCFVSVNTIKTHTAHIYRKLEVPNRNAAIARARQLGLL